jgi:type-F conjugative transfer system pilin assembly protein TrbC
MLGVVLGVTPSGVTPSGVALLGAAVPRPASAIQAQAPKSHGCPDQVAFPPELHPGLPQAGSPHGGSTHGGLGGGCPVGKGLPKLPSPGSSPGLSQLWVLVSLSVPDASLKALAADVKRVGGRLLIRGLVGNSFPQTAQRLRALGIEVDIDPTVFRRTGVQQVPVFIVALPETVEGVGEGAVYDKISGHVTLRYALEQLSQKGQVPGTKALLDSLENRQEARP